MYLGGAYLTYSEIFDRPPTFEEVRAILRTLNRLHTVHLLSRINILLRHAHSEPSRENVGWVQKFLAANFLNDLTLDQLNKRFALVRLEDRPVFHHLQILNILRMAFLFCDGDENHRPDTNVELRYQLGTACLMMSDLLLTKQEEINITCGTTESRQSQMMAQLIAPWEVMNPPDAGHLLFRSCVLFRMLIREELVRQDIRQTCRGFDFEIEFERVAELPLGKWLSLVFAVWAYQMGRDKSELLDHPEFFVINRTSFIKESAVSQAEMDAFLATLSSSLEQLLSALNEPRPADPRFDLIPFRSKPMYQLTDGNFACVDTAFLLEKLQRGCPLAHPRAPRLDKAKRSICRVGKALPTLR